MDTSSPLIVSLTCIALQAMLLWSSGTSQETGFLSVDCGSDAASIYTDGNKIQWVNDTNLISEGTARTVSGIDDHVLATMRLFDGNQSKYCYSLTSPAVEAGAFFLVRAGIWAGSPPPYTPKDSDGSIRFKLIVDANEWYDVEMPTSGSTSTNWWTYDMYTQAQRSTIDVCLARSTPDGDAPFISVLELRPLPATLTTTILMKGTDTIFICLGHMDFGVPASGVSFTRYPSDAMDRIWVSSKASATDEVMTTEVDIDVANQMEKPPSSILQNTLMGSPYITLPYSNWDPKSIHFVEFYFAEIDPTVNASGMRTFNIYANENLLNTSGEINIDVFGQVGANSAYAYRALVMPNSTGDVTFNFTPISTSTFRPFLAAAEYFQVKARTPLTSASAVTVIEDIKRSLGLSSYTGDPCLPIGYGYAWLQCSAAANTTITSLLLSNYSTTGGKIPGTINSLTTLTQVYMDGNTLQGEIPDLSALENLETLDLSNNRLVGSIPDFLATMTNLQVLYLQNNNLSGEIPAALLQRREASLVKFDFSGNPYLCESNNTKACTSLSSSPPTQPPIATPSPTKTKKNSTGLIIGVVVGVMLLIIAIALGICYFCSKRTLAAKAQASHPQSSPRQQELLQVNESQGPVMPVLPKVISKPSIQEFSFQEIITATNNFSNQLGQGGFGPVYKGCLEDGRLVAIKVASDFSLHGSKQFLNEVDLLSRIHHKNLVGLLGYCNDKKLVLVYEFMSNGSLFDCLHGPYSKASPLPWGTRLRILVDAAHGLDYMHSGCNPQIIHRDIKSSNILLSDQMKAKISDFGISKDHIRSDTGVPPTTLMGSTGYIDPEYISSMKLTEKVDVYSFGVLLFEVVCGQRVFLKNSFQEQIHIAEWAKASIYRGVIDDIVDMSLHGHYGAPSVWKVLEVAMACVKMPSFKRPRMSDVYIELKEAERMELGSDEGNAIDKPSMEFIDGSNDSTLSYTHVGTR